MSNLKERILFIVAHPDDDILGSGGTIAKLSKKGSIIHVVFLTDGETSRDNILDPNKLIHKRKNNAKKALKILGCNSTDFLNYQDQRLDSLEFLDIVKNIEKIIKSFKPDKIFTHYENDLNLDHQITCRAVVTASRPKSGSNINELIFFEIPSSTNWNLTKEFKPNYYIDISSTLSLKKKALNIYKDEMRPFPHPRSIKAIESLSYYRGSSSGCKAAEAFIIGRKIKK